MHTQDIPLRNIAPKYDEGVSLWLDVLGGPRLSQWIANVTRLSIKARILYLQGGPRTGKTLLANALSRLWTDNGPTSLGAGLGLGAGLSRCPLVVIEGEYDTQVVKQLAGSQSRVLHRKRPGNTELEGYVRVIVIENKGDASPPPMEAQIDVAAWIETDAIAAHALWLRENLKP